MTDNSDAKYMKKGEILRQDLTQDEEKGYKAYKKWHNPNDESWPYVTADMATSFMILVGVFFPSVTGKLIWAYGSLCNAMLIHLQA